MASAFSATRWVLMGSFGFRVLAYFGQVLILRLVAKEVFGAYGSLVDIHLMLLALLPMSFDALLVREKARRRRYCVALSICLAWIAAFLMALTAGALLLPGPGSGSWAARLVEEGATWHAALFMIPIFAVMATKLSVRALLMADLNFRTISIGEFGNGLITWIGGAAVVFFYPTAWALMGAYLLGELFECLWMYRGHKFRPLAVLAPRRMGVLKRLFNRHRKFCLANTADLTVNNFGSLLPGPLILAWISATATADFRVSRLLIQLPILLLVGSIWRVAYPTFSGVDEETLHSRCLRIIGTTAAFLAPGVIWLAVFAESTAWILGGEQYLTAAPLVKWMAVYMIMTAVFSPISSLDMIRDRPEIGLYWNIVHTVARVLVIWYFAHKGVVVVIAVMSVVSGLLWIIWAALLGWLLRAGWRRYWWSVLKFVPGWLLLALGFQACWWIAPGLLWPPILSILPGLVYLALVYKLFPTESQMIRRLVTRGT